MDPVEPMRDQTTERRVVWGAIFRDSVYFGLVVNFYTRGLTEHTSDSAWLSDPRPSRQRSKSNPWENKTPFFRVLVNASSAYELGLLHRAYLLILCLGWLSRTLIYTVFFIDYMDPARSIHKPHLWV